MGKIQMAGLKIIGILYFEVSSINQIEQEVKTFLAQTEIIHVRNN